MAKANFQTTPAAVAKSSYLDEMEENDSGLRKKPNTLMKIINYIEDHTSTQRANISYGLDVISYWFNNFIQQPGSSVVFLGVLFGIALLIGFILMSISHQDRDPLDNLFLSWQLILDPGTNFDMLEEGMLAFALSIIVLIFGLVVMGLIIGFLTETVVTGMDQLRKGNGKIVEADHMVILGWNDKVLEVIEACCKSGTGAKKIIVLSKESKETMDDEIDTLVLSDRNNVKIITKYGDPLNPQVLSRICIEKARVVVVISDEKLEDQADAFVIMTVVAVLGNPNFKGYVIAELTTESKTESVKHIAGGRVVPVLSPSLVGRFICQTGRQTGLPEVLYDLLDFGGAEFYFKEWPQLVGCTFLDAFYCLEGNGTLCGIIKKRNAEDHEDEIFHFRPSDMCLNPLNDYIIQKGDKMIVIAEDIKAFSFRKKSYTPLRALEDTRFEGPDERPKHLLIVGWREGMDEIMEELVATLPDKSLVSVLSKVPVEHRKIDLSKFDVEIRTEHYVGDTRSPDDLLPVLKKGFPFSNIYVFPDSGNDYDYEQPDAKDNDVSITTLTLCHVVHNRYMKYIKGAAAGGKPASHSIQIDGYPTIVSEIRDPDKMQLISNFQVFKSEWVVGDKFIGMIIALLAVDYYNQGLVEDLLTYEGNDVSIIDHRYYVATGTLATFNELWLRGRQMKQILIGFKLKDKPPVLNPKVKNKAFKFKEGDQLIVISPYEDPNTDKQTNELKQQPELKDETK